MIQVLCEVIMVRWTEQLPHLKWLRPGMGVKRWVVLLIVGLSLLAMAVAAASQAVAFSGLWRQVQRLHLRQINPALEALLLFIAGSVLIAWAFYGLNHSILSAFRRTDQDEVADVVYRHRQRQRGPKIVAIGGGHGLNTLLRGLKSFTDNITAIVTVADDGGSSGRLRRDLGMLPPGDFRNCIAALSDAEGLVSQLFQYRFGNETDLDGHSFGNLYLTAMAAITGKLRISARGVEPGAGGAGVCHPLHVGASDPLWRSAGAGFRVAVDGNIGRAARPDHPGAW